MVLKADIMRPRCTQFGLVGQSAVKSTDCSGTSRAHDNTFSSHCLIRAKMQYISNKDLGKIQHKGSYTRALKLLRLHFAIPS